jgi:hypothetical protein
MMDSLSKFMGRGSILLGLLLVLACFCLWWGSSPSVANENGGSDAWASFTRDWRDDPAWHDGQAEYCTYDATRLIYGKMRTYQARLITNKELADPESKTKSATDKGREVFKHHLRDDIQTENYTYHFSTMCYVGSSDLKSLKIDMGSQEDCGTTFKQFIHHAGRLTWNSFVYFPDTGYSHGDYNPPNDFVFQDALSVVLRGYPFNDPRTIEVSLLPDQTSTHPTSPEPEPATITYVGLEELGLPVGTVNAHHLRVIPVTGGPDSAQDYWFAAEGSAPWFHVMVRYQGPNGITYKLRSTKRWAYWQH